MRLPTTVRMSAFTSRLDHPAAAVLVTAGLTLLYLVGLLWVRDFDPSRFVVAGDAFVDRSAAPEGLFVLEDSYGYDGQFYYRLALDPFTDRQTDFGITIDEPWYRQQRILYPLLARALSLGRPGLLPAALIGVNVLGLCAMAWMGAAYARRTGHHALAGLAFSLYGGFLLVLARDLVEITELALLLASFLCLRAERPRWAAIGLSVAVLAKEPALLAAIAALLARVASRGRGETHPSWHLAIWPLVVFALWQMWILTNWEVSLLAPAEGRLRRPVLAFFELWGSALAGNHPHPALVAIELLLILAFAIAVAMTARRSAATLHEKIAALLFAILVFSRAEGVWSEDWSFLRTSADFYFTGTMILLHAEARVARLVPAAVVACWLPLAIHVLMRF